MLKSKQDAQEALLNKQVAVPVPREFEEKDAMEQEKEYSQNGRGQSIL